MQKRDKWSMVSLDKHLLRAIQSIFIVNPSSTYLTNNINDKKETSIHFKWNHGWTSCHSRCVDCCKHKTHKMNSHRNTKLVNKKKLYPSIENIKKRIGELKVQNILTNKWKKSHGKRWQLLNKINASYILFFFFFLLLSFSLLKHRTITYAETCSVLQSTFWLHSFGWIVGRLFTHEKYTPAYIYAMQRFLYFFDSFSMHLQLILTGSYE